MSIGIGQKKIIFSFNKKSFSLVKRVRLISPFMSVSAVKYKKTDVVKYIAMKMDRKQICFEYVTKDQKGKYL